MASRSATATTARRSSPARSWRNPPATWRVYRLTLGEGGPQCFLGLSADDRAAVLLPRVLEDGPAIQARFRSLLGRGPAAS